jgi:hypothetical protein
MNFLQRAITTYDGYSEMYSGGLSLKPKDKMSQEDANTLMSSVIQELADKDSKQTFTVRYANTAMGSADKVAMEITLPVNTQKMFGDKYLSDTPLSPQKFTVYMDKSAYNGYFKDMGRSNAYDNLMKMNGFIDLTSSDSDIVKNTAVRRTNDGRYYISGMIYDGETKKWGNFSSTMFRNAFYNTPTEAVTDWNNIRQILRVNAQN